MASTKSTVRLSPLPLRTHDSPDTELVFRATNDLDLFGRLSAKVLQTVQDAWALDTNPLFAVLHEAIYCQGCAPHAPSRAQELTRLQTGVELERRACCRGRREV